MNRIELITLSMYRLGGDAKSLDIEDIAMEASRISPDTFAWRKYKDQINLELVGFAVRDGKKEKYGKLISGSHATGWRLTVHGQELGRQLEEETTESGQDIDVIPVRSKAIEKSRIEKELVRALSSNAYVEWNETGEVGEQSMIKLLKINAYTSNDLLEIKKTRLATCKGVDDEADQFIDYVLTYKFGKIDE